MIELDHAISALMNGLSAHFPLLLLALYVGSQVLYTVAFLVDLYFFTRPVNWVHPEEARHIPEAEYPYIVLFYPVLRELEETMRTTMLSLAKIDYPADKYRVVAIPNADDTATVASLRRLQQEFAFLQMVAVPPTSDPSWQVVWSNWDRTEKAYWWHRGDRAGVRDLPPKKTRQLIYAFYNMAEELRPLGDFLINYIDADSVPPKDHFLAAAAGIRHYDVLQAENIAGNLNASMAASWHAFDHMAWDGMKYRHLSADGKQPYWVLGKGLFFKASDLLKLGGFHPWITIEDPEVGMRFWVNGKRLGIIKNPLIEEVPHTIRRGIIQRKRWVAGFFQSLTSPLREMGMTRWQRFKAWLNFLPCLSLTTNAIGIPVGVWALWTYLDHTSILPWWTVYHAAVNVAAYVVFMIALYWSTWKRTALVLDTLGERLWYMLRVNPVSMFIWWLMWMAPLVIGFSMYLRDGGLVWQRTEKIDANHDLVRTHVVAPAALPALPALDPTNRTADSDNGVADSDEFVPIRRQA